MEINGPTGRLRILLAILVGLGAMGYGTYSYTAQTAALSSAETVEATIVSTSVDRDSGRRSVSFVPHATFNYSYEGESYTSSNVYPGPLPRDFDTESAARDAIDEYETGTTVTAYVPPDSPGNAYLKHESSYKPFLVIGFGVLFVLGGVRSALKG